jgi:hypothetical protein
MSWGKVALAAGGIVVCLAAWRGTRIENNTGPSPSEQKCQDAVGDLLSSIGSDIRMAQYRINLERIEANALNDWVSLLTAATAHKEQDATLVEEFADGANRTADERAKQGREADEHLANVLTTMKKHEKHCAPDRRQPGPLAAR